MKNSNFPVLVLTIMKAFLISSLLFTMFLCINYLLSKSSFITPENLMLTKICLVSCLIAGYLVVKFICWIPVSANFEDENDEILNPEDYEF